ncbi:MAG: hypothetical protein AABX64_01010 [Nanoarchaeota archaeon]
MKKAIVLGVIITVLMSFSVFGVLTINNLPPLTTPTEDTLTLRTLTDPDELLVELEVKDASTPQFWVDVYLTSATHTQLVSAKLKLITSDISVAKFMASSEFHAPFSDFDLSSGSSYAYLILDSNYDSPVQITPGAKMYLGRIKMQNPKALTPGQALTSGTFQVNMQSDSLASYGLDKSGQAGFYTLILAGNSFCVPKLDCGPSAVCGAVDDGCGGLINCGVCGPGLGQVCVNNACVSAVLGLTPTDELFCKTAAGFGSTDKSLLQGVVDAINGEQENVDVVLDIFTALDTWFKAR